MWSGMVLNRSGGGVEWSGGVVEGVWSGGGGGVCAS